MGRSWELVGGHWWHASGIVNAVIAAPFGATNWFVQWRRRQWRRWSRCRMAF